MRGGREFILKHHPSTGRIPWDVGELNVEELWDVERTVVIPYVSSSVRIESRVVVTDEPTGGYWSRKENASGVYCLEDSLEVALSGDFSNQDGGEPFMAQFFYHAKEVDLACLDLPITESTFETERSSGEHVLPSDT